MTRARFPRPHEIAAAKRDPRLAAARSVDPDDLTWRARAQCIRVDPDVMFPHPMASTEVALNQCRMCRVRPECLRSALELGAEHGVWGGTTPRERRSMQIVLSRGVRAVS